MDTDDLEPRKRQPGAPDLPAMSIEALAEYIEELRTEISRAEAMIVSKNAARGVADDVFKI
jgi:uncharacterized small protein (DUF1192 family)